MSVQELADGGLESALDCAREAATSQMSDHTSQDLVAWLALAKIMLGGQLPSWAKQALPTDSRALDNAMVALENRWSRTQVAPGELATSLEEHLARTDLGQRDGRRHKGAYYTPPQLIDLVVERTLAPVLGLANTVDDVLSLRIIDPAVGAGGFLVSAARQLADRIVEVSDDRLSHSEALAIAVPRCLFGVDADPLAALLAAAELACLTGGLVPENNVQWADTLLPADLMVSGGSAPPLDVSQWASRVPDGFDIAIGNPPWGAVKPAVRTYLAASGPSLLGAQGADLKARLHGDETLGASWELHASDVRSYARELRESGAYIHQGRGDADLYRYFLERTRQLLRPSGGRFGLLVPAAFLRADGCTPLRNLLFDEGSFETIAEVLNTGRLFDIHAMFRFAVLVWQQGDRQGIAHAQFGARTIDDLRAAGKTQQVGMSLAFIDRVSSGRRTVPDVRSTAQASLLARLYDEHPTLEEPGCNWNCRYVRELDMTNDSHLFRHAHDDAANQKLVPVYEGRMVHQFDTRAKRYEGGAGRRAVWAAQGLGERALASHYLVTTTTAYASGAGAPRAGFCDITGHANERTVLAALLPANAVAGNKVPTLRFDRQDSALHLIWLAVANSFVVDWVARRRVSTSLNFFQLGQLPFPRIEPSTRLGESLVLASEYLSNSDTRWTADVLKARAAQRAELDAMVAEAFRLDLPALALLLQDFPLLDRHQPGVAPSHRSTITRDLVLSTFARRCGDGGITLRDLGLGSDHGPNIIAERVSVAQANGQIAYVPGEVARVLITS